MNVAERNWLSPSSVLYELHTIVIAIVSYRNYEDVHACLSALESSTERNFMISICENGGVSSYRALIENLMDLVEFENITLHLNGLQIREACAGRLKHGRQTVRIFCANTNLGYAGGVNICIRQLGQTDKWGAVWVLNPDTEPDPNALAALIKRAREGHFSIVGGRLVSKSTRRVQCWGSRWRSFIGRGWLIGRDAPFDAVPNVAEIERKINYVSGASMFVTRYYIEEIGLMDERYFLYCEEVDWCLRGRHHKMGYAHDAIVRHAHGTTLGSSVNRKEQSQLSVYLAERNGLLLTRKFYPARFYLVIPIKLLQIGLYLRPGAFSNFVAALYGWLAGLRGEEGLPQWPSLPHPTRENVA